MITRPDRGVSVAPTPSRYDRLVLRDGRQRHLVPIGDLLWVESCGNYTQVYTAEWRRLHRGTLSAMVHDLASHGFVRIHRRLLVNVTRVSALRARAGGRYEVRLDTGHRLPVSRTHQATLREHLRTVFAPDVMPRAALPAASRETSPAQDFLHDVRDLLVLRALSRGVRHEDGIARWIAGAVDDPTPIAAVVVSSALSRFERRGHVTAEWGMSERGWREMIYHLTPAGCRALAVATERWATLAHAVARALLPDGGDADSTGAEVVAPTEPASARGARVRRGHRARPTRTSSARGSGCRTDLRPRAHGSMTTTDPRACDG